MEYCCEYFEKCLLEFGWFSYEDDNGDTIYVMPHLEHKPGDRIRINHCPVCGKEVRDIHIPEKDFKQSINNNQKL